jgi:hypothetical protein
MKAKLTNITPSKPGVVIFALPRGGSTMVADALASEEGVWIASEPFMTSSHRRGGEIRQEMVPSKPRGQMFDLSDHEQQKVDRYFDALLAGELRTVGMAARPKPVMKSDRVVLKVLNALWQLKRVSSRTSARTLVVTRHPASQALSMINRDWTPPLDAYLAAPEALEELFSRDEVEALLKMAHGADSWMRAVLSWLVQAKPLLAWQSEADAFWTYEDIVMSPERFVDETAIEGFGFTERQTMLDSLAAPSNSIRFSDATTRNILEEGERQSVLKRWKGALASEEKRTGQAVLDRFGIDLYRFRD